MLTYPLFFFFPLTYLGVYQSVYASLAQKRCFYKLKKNKLFFTIEKGIHHKFILTQTTINCPLFKDTQAYSEVEICRVRGR